MEETPEPVVEAEPTAAQPDAAERLAELGVRNPGAQTMLIYATQGRADVVMLHLATGVPIDAFVSGRTVLLTAVQYNHLDLAMALIKAKSPTWTWAPQMASPPRHPACGPRAGWLRAMLS